MKKIFLFFMIGVCFLLGACSADDRSADGLIVKSDFYNSYTFSVDVGASFVTLGGHRNYFDLPQDMDLRDLCAAIEEKTDAAVSCKIFNDILLIEVSHVSTSYFAVQKLKDDEIRYTISDMAAFMYSEHKKAFLFPYHFCKDVIHDDSKQKLSFNLWEGEKIATDHGYSQWKEFYAKLDRADIVFDDALSQIVIDGRFVMTVAEGSVLCDLAE